MKKFIAVNIIAICFPLFCFCQWNNHYFFNVFVNPPWTSSFNDVIFTSSDTGYYCYTVYAPSPSTPNDIFLKKTTNDCNTWSSEYQYSALGISSYVVKYFKPHIYYLWNNQGVLRIDWKLENSNWQSLPATFGYYRDFFVNDSSNYKILYIDYSNRIILRFFQNNIEVKTDTFLTNKPSRIFYPIDTVGILLSSSFPSTGFNTVILKYAPTSGYNLVYQNQNQKLSDLYYTTGLFGYVAGDSGIVLRSNDLGNNWTALNTGFVLKLNSIYFINDSIGYVVGDSGLILKTTNYGLSWQQQISPTNTTLNKVFFVNDSVGFILSGQTLLKTTNGGIGWINETPLKTNVLSVFPNPTTKLCNIKIPSDFITERHLTLYLYGSSGKLIQQYPIDNYSEIVSITLDKEAKGLYNILLSDGKKIYSSKIIIE